jgi:hypothetical protein
MNRSNNYVPLGLLLVVAGMLFLAQNFGIFNFAWDLVFALLFAGGGVAFLAVFASGRANWWAVIPGFVLLGLASVMVISRVAPGLEEVGGALFLGSIALSFWVVYLVERENWWAVIPAGVLSTLSFITLLSQFGLDMELGGIFFLGLAATFALVYFLPNPQGPMRWAAIPAVVLGVMGFLLLIAMSQLINWLWPLALIAGGGFLVLRAVMRNQWNS